MASVTGSDERAGGPTTAGGAHECTPARSVEAAERVVIRVGATRIIELIPEGANAGAQSFKGHLIADLTSAEIATATNLAKGAVNGLIEARKYTGRLVELDPTSVEMLATAKKVVEKGGWVQGTLRGDSGQIARIIRIRPANFAQVASSGAGIIAGIAEQAQAAQLAADVRETLDRVKAVAEYHYVNDRARLVQLITDTERVIELTRAGTTDRTAADARELAHDLRHERQRILMQLETRLTSLPTTFKSSRKAAKALDEETAGRLGELWAMANLAHAALAEAEHIVVANELRLGEPEQAQALAARVAREFEEAETRLTAVDEQLDAVRAAAEGTYRELWRRMLLVGPKNAGVGSASSAIGGAATLAAKVTVVPRLASGVAGALAPVAVVAPFAVAQHRAQKAVAVRLDAITTTGQGHEATHGVHFRRVERTCKEWAALESPNGGTPEPDVDGPDCADPEPSP